MEVSNLSLFMSAAFMLIFTPGPAVLYITTKSMEQGWKAGFVSTLGIEFATLVHVGAATLGISTILMASPVIFDLIKILGVVYLLYLGIRKLTSRAQLSETDGQKHKNLRSVFSQAVTVELLNPQTALFFLAFLPQFVDPAQGAVPLQFLTLGMIFVTLAVIVEGSYALLVGILGGWLKNCPRLMCAQHYLSGVVYIGLAIMAASYSGIAGHVAI